MRAAVTLMTLIAALLPVACGGGSDSNSHRATLTDDGCTYEGDTALPAGTVTIDVENQTDFFGAFALARLADGRTIDDLKPQLEQAQREFDQSGGTPPPPPDYYEQSIRIGVERGATSELPADVSPGTYALMCFVDDLPTWRVYAAAQLDVSE
jgi:hypothetical protein